jgi:hypothetical protein
LAQVNPVWLAKAQAKSATTNAETNHINITPKTGLIVKLNHKTIKHPHRVGGTVFGNGCAKGR